MSASLYPLPMSPFLRTLVWGGDRLAAYGKAVKVGAPLDVPPPPMGLDGRAAG